jgi:hypothetical protein
MWTLFVVVLLVLGVDLSKGVIQVTLIDDPAQKAMNTTEEVTQYVRAHHSQLATFFIDTVKYPPILEATIESSNVTGSDVPCSFVVKNYNDRKDDTQSSLKEVLLTWLEKQSLTVDADSITVTVDSAEQSPDYPDVSTLHITLGFDDGLSAYRMSPLLQSFISKRNWNYCWGCARCGPSCLYRGGSLLQMEAHEKTSLENRCP